MLRWVRRLYFTRNNREMLEFAVSVSRSSNYDSLLAMSEQHRDDLQKQSMCLRLVTRCMKNGQDIKNVVKDQRYHGIKTYLFNHMDKLDNQSVCDLGFYARTMVKYDGMTFTDAEKSSFLRRVDLLATRSEFLNRQIVSLMYDLATCRMYSPTLEALLRRRLNSASELFSFMELSLLIYVFQIMGLRVKRDLAAKVCERLLECSDLQVAEYGLIYQLCTNAELLMQTYSWKELEVLAAKLWEYALKREQPPTLHELDHCIICVTKCPSMLPEVSALLTPRILHLVPEMTILNLTKVFAYLNRIKTECPYRFSSELAHASIARLLQESTQLKTLSILQFEKVMRYLCGLHEYLTPEVMQVLETHSNQFQRVSKIWMLRIKSLHQQAVQFSPEQEAELLQTLNAEDGPALITSILALENEEKNQDLIRLRTTLNKILEDLAAKGAPRLLSLLITLDKGFIVNMQTSLSSMKLDLLKLIRQSPNSFSPKNRLTLLTYAFNTYPEVCSQILAEQKDSISVSDFHAFTRQFVDIRNMQSFVGLAKAYGERAGSVCFLLLKFMRRYELQDSMIADFRYFLNLPKPMILHDSGFRSNYHETFQVVKTNPSECGRFLSQLESELKVESPITHFEIRALRYLDSIKPCPELVEIVMGRAQPRAIFVAPTNYVLLGGWPKEVILEKMTQIARSEAIVDVCYRALAVLQVGNPHTLAAFAANLKQYLTYQPLAIVVRFLRELRTILSAAAYQQFFLGTVDAALQGRNCGLMMLCDQINLMEFLGSLGERHVKTMEEMAEFIRQNSPYLSVREKKIIHSALTRAGSHTAVWFAQN